MVRAFDGDELLGLGRKAEKLLTLRERNDRVVRAVDNRERTLDLADALQGSA